MQPDAINYSTSIRMIRHDLVEKTVKIKDIISFALRSVIGDYSKIVT